MSSDYCDYLADMLAGWDKVTAKRMFGGFGLYRRGLMFALIAGDTPYFKTDATNRGDYEQAGMPPFSYAAKGGKTVVMSYWQVPPEVLEDADMLAIWAEKAYRAAATARKE